MFRKRWSGAPIPMTVSQSERARVRVARERQEKVKRWSEGGLVMFSVLVLTLMLLTMAGHHGLIGSSPSMIDAFDALNHELLSAAVGEPEARRGPAFGACGDLCDSGGACRFVVLTDGVHNRQLVTRDFLNAAQSCR